MKWLEEVRSVEIADIPKPEGWDEVLSEDRTKALAANIPQTDGPVNLPVLNAATMCIVAGKHRIAACSLAGRPRVQVRLVTCSPAQERFLRASDNAFPRDDYDAWVHELVDARAAVIEEERLTGQAVREVTASRPPSVRGEARRDVAGLLGKSAEAVRKADERATRPKKLDIRMPDGKPFEPPPPAEPESAWSEPAEPEPPPEPAKRPPHIEARDLAQLAVDHLTAGEEVLWKAFHAGEVLKVKTWDTSRPMPSANVAVNFLETSGRQLADVIKQVKASVNDLTTIARNLAATNQSRGAEELLPGEKRPRTGLRGRKL